MLETWISDSDHSELVFKVRHLMLVHTTGKIGRFTVNLKMQEDNLETAEFEMHAALDSLSTLHDFRDKRIKDPDILNVKQFPKMSFYSTQMEAAKNANEFILKGNLTIKGNTKPVRLQLIYNGKATDSYSGEEKMGMELTTIIDRRQWGVDFNLPFDGEGVAVGNEVKIRAELEFKKVED